MKFIDCQRSKHSLLKWGLFWWRSPHFCCSTSYRSSWPIAPNPISVELAAHHSNGEDDYSAAQSLPSIQSDSSCWLAILWAYSMCLAWQVPTQSQRATCVDRWLDPTHNKKCAGALSTGRVKDWTANTHDHMHTAASGWQHINTQMRTHTHWMNINIDIE